MLNGPNRMKREQGKLVKLKFLVQSLCFSGIRAIISIVCVGFFLVQSFQLIGDYFKEETFITPSKSRLDEMPSPTITFCDKYGDGEDNSEDVATIAVDYSSDYQHNESSLVPTFSKENTFYQQKLTLIICVYFLKGNCTSFRSMQLSTKKQVDMYFQESFGFCLSVNESLVNFVFPGQEFFVTLSHPEKDLQFYEQVSDWTTYRVTTRMKTKISKDVEKCKNTKTDFKSLMNEYEEYQNCLLNHTFNVQNILFLGYPFPVTYFFPKGRVKK